MTLKELFEDINLIDRTKFFKEGKVSWEWVIYQLNDMLNDFTLHTKLRGYLHKCLCVNGAPIENLATIAAKLKDPEYILNLLWTFPMFPFDKVLWVVSNGKNAKCMYDLAHAVENDIEISLDILTKTGYLPGNSIKEIEAGENKSGYFSNSCCNPFITVWLSKLVPENNLKLKKIINESLETGFISDKEKFISFCNASLRKILKILGDAISKTGDEEYIDSYFADFPNYSQDLALTRSKNKKKGNLNESNRWERNS